jgi:hypothetical protein
VLIALAAVVVGVVLIARSRAVESLIEHPVVEPPGVTSAAARPVR